MSVIKEKILDKYPLPISIKQTEIILQQMKSTICKICMNDGSKSTGFFCKIPFPNN